MIYLVYNVDIHQRGRHLLDQALMRHWQAKSRQRAGMCLRDNLRMGPLRSQCRAQMAAHSTRACIRDLSLSLSTSYRHQQVLISKPSKVSAQVLMTESDTGSSAFCPGVRLSSLVDRGCWHSHELQCRQGRPGPGPLLPVEQVQGCRV